MGMKGEGAARAWNPSVNIDADFRVFCHVIQGEQLTERT
jgi:hypothetical protein